jgi:hypothetical protein
MAQAKSVSLSHFNNTVKAAVKSAVQKHPKLKLEVPTGAVFGYLIWGIPAPPTFFQNVNFAEAQAFADDLAANIVVEPEFSAMKTSAGKGAIYSGGGHLILGFPPVYEITFE